MSEGLHERARRWLGDDALAALAAGPSPERDQQSLSLAWLVREIGHEALYTDLALSRRAVERLDRLAAGLQAEGARRELTAIRAWLAGAEAAMSGRSEQALGLLDEAYAAFIAAGRHHDAAASQVPKVMALTRLGRHDDALRCGVRTRTELVACGDERAAGKVDLNLGSMLLHLHRYADAASHYREAAVRFARVRDKLHSVMADIGLAGSLSWQHDLDEAARIYERAEARILTHGLDSLRGVVHSSRGLLEMRRGAYHEALRFLALALTDFELSGPPPRLAEARRDLADAYLALNLLPEAVALYDQAVEAARSSQTPIEEAWALMQRARARARLGHPGEAAQGLVRACEIFDSHGNRVGAARAGTHLAELALLLGRPDRAARDADTAAERLDAEGTRAWSLEARVLAAEARMLPGAEADPAAAGAAFEAVLADSVDQPELQARCHSGLARLAHAALDVATARRHYEAAAACIEAQRARLPGDEFRTAYADNRLSAFDGLVELALDDPTPSGTGRLLTAMERARARSLGLALAEPATGDEGAPSQRAELQWLQMRHQQAVALGDENRRADLGVKLREAEHAWQEALRRQRATRPVAHDSGPSAAAAAAAQPEVSLAEVQWRLEDDEALVAFTVIGSRAAAVLVRRRRVEQVELDTQGLADRVERLRFQVNALRFGAPALQRHGPQMLERMQRHLAHLHAQVWAPLTRWLGGVERICLLPHGPLHYVPFAALHDGEQALVDRHAIGHAPSLALWLQARALPAPAARAALVVGLGGPQLPHVATEVNSVADAFEGDARVLCDGAATLHALRAALPGRQVLHLACHGQFRADNPYFSSLQLADGALTMRDAAALPLQGMAVTLSACETGLSRVAAGDELLGLVRGFQLAGAATVMSTLWTVDDAGTALLMGSFYRALRAGIDSRQALRNAQRTLRETHQHPYYWAPFTLHGRR